MLITTMMVTMAMGTAPTQLPDELDLFRGGQTKPNVALSLDASGSMRGGALDTPCGWYATTYTGGNTRLSKIHMLRASLLGCRNDSDGILEKWYNNVNFSIFTFPTYLSDPTVDFGTPLADMKTAVVGITLKGWTPITPAVHIAANHFMSHFNNGNSVSCRPNFLVLLSDGRPTGGNRSMDMACSGNVVAAGGHRPWEATQYIYDEPDMLCSVDGNQNISTYTVKFGSGGGAATLQQMADLGGGDMYYATNVSELDRAFDEIIASIVSRSAVFMSSPASQRSSLFAGEYSYSAAYKPTGRGGWIGNLKKHCLLPPMLGSGRYDTSETRCLYLSTDGLNLMTNPEAEDLWTGTTTTTADIGGALSKMHDRIGAPGNPPRAPIRSRNIVSWRGGNASYVRVQPGTWSRERSWSQEQDYNAFLNSLHGYTREADPASGVPVQVSNSAIGDPIHAQTAFLRYGDCSARGQCFAVMASNDGMLHFFDTFDGRETTALIPWDVWQPNNVARNLLRDIDDQPGVDVGHRYYLDGGVRLFLDDEDGDLTIDSTETAYLVFGLGRAGRAYYMIPVSRFNGTLTSGRNPVLPLPFSPGTAFQELRATWRAPWLGKIKTDTIYNAAIFGSGHIPEFDEPTAPTPSFAPAPDAISGVQTISCVAAAAAAGWDPTGCNLWVPFGYPDPFPMDIPIGGMLEFGDYIAIRAHFDSFELDPNDTLYIEDDKRRGGVALTGAGVAPATEPWSSGLSGGWTPWIYTDSIGIRIVMDGITTAARGLVLDRFEYISRSAAGTQLHYPTVYVVNLDKWNGAAQRPFVSTADGNGILMRFAKSCSGAGAGDCVSQAVSPDLRHMTCPISTEISAYTVANQVQSFYWGDECGQIWKAYKNAADQWRAKRLIALNNADVSNQAASRGQSKDFRKIFTKLDLVTSRCPGQKVIGVYFGTGNVQRPVAQDELRNGALNSGRDVIGVVWDTGSNSNLTISSLEDATNTVEVDPTAILSGGKFGWYIELDPDERMLRNPLVFQGTAYYKTFSPTAVASECSSAAGVDRVYAMSNCTAAPTEDRDGGGTSTSDREAWEGATDIGGELTIITPKNGKPIVTHGDRMASTKAALATTGIKRIPSIYHWRFLREGL